jgi:hypothetical protein
MFPLVSHLLPRIVEVTSFWSFGCKSKNKYVLNHALSYTDTDTGMRYGDTPIHHFPKNTDTGIRQHKKIKQKRKQTTKSTFSFLSCPWPFPIFSSISTYLHRDFLSSSSRGFYTKPIRVLSYPIGVLGVSDLFLLFGNC